MPLSIKSPEADLLARKLAATTGETMTEAVTIAIRERLASVEQRRNKNEALLEEIRAISHHCASLPVLDQRTEDEIMGWDENGLPS